MIAGYERMNIPARNFLAGKIFGRRSVQLIYIDAGGGHRSAALALEEILHERHPGWDIKLVNLFEDVLRPIDPLRRVTRTYNSEDIYNRLLKHNWTYGFYASMRGLQKLITLSAPVIERLLRQYWQKNHPDLVVSLIPHFNAVMFRALKEIYPGVPYVTIMTDLADCPPHMWQEKQDQFLIVGSDMAAAQAKKAGYPASRVFQASGMIIKPGFYRFRPGDQGAERRKQGLDPERPTALIMFGGYGAQAAEKIVTTLHAKLDVQSIVMCGRNAKLHKKLEKRRYCRPIGFTPDGVPYYMSLADFFIGKPGPGSISEALHMGLPVIVERNTRTMPQERYNTEWIREQDVGIVLKSFSSIVKNVRHLLEGNHLEEMRRNARAIKNRAVYEIPGMLEKIVEADGTATKNMRSARG
jgi:1,2-diacylglycerol 3-beta-galactosyltransferase